MGAREAFAQAPFERSPTWIGRSVEPAFSLRVPEGFMRQDPEGAAYAAFIHPGRRAIFMVYELDEPLAQGTSLTREQLARLREGRVGELDERPTTFRALGFEVPGSIGRGAVDDRRVVRFAATLPLRGGTPVVVLLGPEEREGELRRSLESTLASARGRTHWRTPRQKIIDRISGWGFLFALVASIAYGIGMLTRWRRAASTSDAVTEPPSIARVALRATVGLGWSASALWWLTHSDWMFVAMGVLLLLVGVQQSIGAAGLLRARRDAATR
jgi:hypothetical protein